MFSFNLIEERWLPCVMLDGSLRDLSLWDVLTNAPNIKELVGDSPPVTIALHRLLLAILHRALNAPQNYEDWNDFWQAKIWNGEGKLNKYLADWKHRFDLFDEKRPFYQVASVKDSVQNGAIIQLYFQGKNNATLFEHSTTGEPKAVSPAEAARLLVTFQGFDFGGIKADGAGGKRSLLLSNAIALVRGENLFETLMLNFHAYNEDDEMPFSFRFSKDLPIWERDEETEVRERRPDGYVDLLTWQSRRILLQPQKDESGKIVVKNNVIMKGFHCPSDFQLSDKETMMAFKKSKKEGIYAIGLNENKALWRDSLSLFQTIAGEQSRPKMLDWLNNLVYEDYLQRSSVFPIDFYGLKNSNENEAKLLFWQQDRFNLPLVYLNSNELLEDLRNAISFAEDISKVIYAGSRTLATFLLAPKSDNKNEKQPDAKNVSALMQSFAVETKYWANLETRFQRLLSTLPNDKETAMRDWFEFVDATAKRAFDNTANSLSGSANEQKAIVEAESSFYRTRAKLLKENSKYRENLPNYETKGGN